MIDLQKFTKNGKFLMLALDHRGSFKRLMNPPNPEAVTDERIISLKNRIIEALVDQFSGLLIDETYGLEAYSDHQKPFLLPVEKSGYQDLSGERVNEAEYRITQLITYGASGAKLLLFINPDLATAQTQIGLAKEVLKECQENNFPFFLEPVTYRKGGVDHTQDPNLVLRSLQKFKEEGVTADVFKVEYPGNLEACQQITQILGDTPWILLANPDSFDTFTEHLKQAVAAGCQGFLAGRALWQEVCLLEGESKQEFLAEILPERFKTLVKIMSFG